MTLQTKQWIIFVLGLAFLGSLFFVQWQELVRKEEELGVRPPHVIVPASSQDCVSCHFQHTPGIVDHWKGSTHAEKGVGCVDCHQANKGDADAFFHEGAMIATIVTPRDCSRCHQKEFEEFEHSHHAKAGNILASLDNRLAETVEGSRVPFNPHSPTPGRDVTMVNGMASVDSGCRQCHGSKVALEAIDGGTITVDELKPDDQGRPTNQEAFARIKRDKDKYNRPVLTAASWPNTGIGRLNLDGSLGSCSACHSRHDFSPRRARQPENCGKCHLGPDHPQKEIYEESKHGVAFRDLREHMNLDSTHWVLGKDYTQAPTCASCHMSANTRDLTITHDPGQRISWTNRPPISLAMDTDVDHKVITETDPQKREDLIADTWQAKRDRMKNVCLHCHTNDYVNAFYKQYDDFVINYNEKFAKPAKGLMDYFYESGKLTRTPFDEKLEWTYYELWHHEGRRARHGASMQGPDFTQWHGFYEVAKNFYTKFLPECEEIQKGVTEQILASEYHSWKKGMTEDQKKKVLEFYKQRYGQ